MSHTTQSKLVDAPRRALKKRLLDVAQLLQSVSRLTRGDKKPSQARKAARIQDNGEDPEISATKLLHELRVACRRGETALKACDSHLAATDSTWFRRQMQKIRKSCNSLRDDEVLRKWVRQQSGSDRYKALLESLAKGIKSGYSAVSERARNLIQRQRFRQRIQKALPLDECPSDAVDHSPLNSRSEPDTSNSASWRHELGKWLFRVLNEVIQAVPKHADDPNELHQLRIAVKRLRYGMEFATDVDPQLRLHATARLLQEIQDLLGAIHDGAVRQKRLEKVFAKRSDGDALIAIAIAEAEQSAADWNAWWQPSVFKRILRQTNAEVVKLLTDSVEPS